MKIRYTLITVLFVTVVAIVMFAPLPAAHARQEVCPEGGKWSSHFDGVEDSTTSYTAPEGKLVAESCVKAGSDVSTDGQARKFTNYNPAEKTVNLSSATGKAISHFSVRLVDVPSTATTNVTVVIECDSVTVTSNVDFDKVNIIYGGEKFKEYPDDVRTYSRTFEGADGKWIEVVKVRTSHDQKARLFYADSEGCDLELGPPPTEEPTPEPTVEPTPEPTIPPETPSPEPTPELTVEPTPPVEPTPEVTESPTEPATVVVYKTPPVELADTGPAGLFLTLLGAVTLIMIGLETLARVKAN